MPTLICDCNKTMPLDGPALAKALGTDAAAGVATVHSTLCRREAPSFQRAARTSADLLVACTQESRLFAELAAATEGAPSVAERPIRFVNIRETAGWSKDGAAALPKIAALLAAAQLPEPEPVPTVSYASAGRVLVIGDADRAARAAAMLADRLDVSVLLPRPGGTLPQERKFAVHSGRLGRIGGWLGAFEVAWTSGNPIDLDLCTRCNACIEVCPESAIDFSYQIDLARCTGHRECVRACGAAAAIDFMREPVEVEMRFDLVLDLGTAAAIDLHQPPQGYFHAPDDAALVTAVLALRDSVGEFEKAKFFQYRPKICAHSRNGQIGCTACLDVCSAAAIRSDAKAKGGSGGIVVEPHLCVGCGACTTVCPSGALTYAAPRPNELGERIRTMLATYARAGGKDAALLLHSEAAGAQVLNALGRAARTDPAIRGVPARVLPVDVWHTASVGIDVWLAALAHGAVQVWVLVTDEEAPAYREAIAAQMRIAQAIVSGLGFAGEHFRVVGGGEVARLDDAGLAAPFAGRAGSGVDQPTAFAGRTGAGAGSDAEQPTAFAGRTGAGAGSDADQATAFAGRAASGRHAPLAGHTTPSTSLPARAGSGPASARPRVVVANEALHRLDQALRKPSAQGVVRAATFAVQPDKRTTLDLALEHLMTQAASVPDEIALATPVDGPRPLFGNIVVDRAACTMCLACVGACPEGALLDNPDRPQLRFIEKNCVQCGICASTCPEDAITLAPRLLLADAGKARKLARLLNEAEPYACVRCAKPFGTLRAIEAMLERLSGHAMFQGAAAERLKMCSDCRVIDLYSSPDEVRIGEL